MEHIEKQLGKMNRTLRKRNINGREVYDSVPKQYYRPQPMDTLFTRTLHIIDDKIYTEEEVKKIRGW